MKKIEHLCPFLRPLENFLYPEEASMALPKYAERRLSERRKVVHPISAQLCTQDGRIEADCQLLDVSEAGLGVFTEDEVGNPGDTILLFISGTQFEVELVWSRENPGKKVGYRLGLKRKDERINIEEICRLLGLLD
jgi:hypothetical protein